MNSDPIQVILSAFEERGQGRYGSEEVSQLEHALQCATLAVEDGASNQQIVAALLHDLGHIISGDDLPTGLDENLDDMHEERAYQWLLLHFGPDVAEPVRLHVAAKRYLCTVEPSYASTLSPTSLKSFHDQGGEMSGSEVQEFRALPHYHLALQLRRWDDQAKDPNLETQPIDGFVSYLTACLRTSLPS